MSILRRGLQTVQASDLRELVGLEESMLVDAKLRLPGGSDGERKEYCRDVSSLANALGGTLAYGAEEKAGVITDLPGLEDIDPERECARLVAMVDAGIRPRIVGVEVRSFESNGRHVILVRVPQSWNRPHQCVVAGDQSFWVRTSAGKRPMDVDELRRGFGGARAWLEAARDFRRQRASLLDAGQGSAQIPSATGFAVLHVIPLSALEQPHVLDFANVGRDEPPLMGSDHYARLRFNADGLCNISAGPSPNPRVSYTQLFRNGAVEAVMSPISTPSPNGVLHHIRLLRDAASVTQWALAFMRRQDVPPPFLVGLTCCRVLGARIQVSILEPWTQTIDRDTVSPTEVMFETGEEGVESTMQSIFDAIWNASGYAAFPGWDETGRLRV